MSWKFFLGLFGLLLTLTVASLGWAARGGATTRQVEVNTVAIVEAREDLKEHEGETRTVLKTMDDKLDKLALGQARMAARLDISID